MGENCAIFAQFGSIGYNVPESLKMEELKSFSGFLRDHAPVPPWDAKRHVRVHTALQ